MTTDDRTGSTSEHSTGDWPEGYLTDHVKLTTPTRYRITDYRSDETTNGIAWSGTVQFDGKTVGMADNDGHGGSTWCHIDDEHLAAFNAEAAARYPALDTEFARTEAFANDLVELHDLATLVAPHRIVVESVVAWLDGRFTTVEAATAAQAAAQVTGPAASTYLVYDDVAGCLRTVGDVLGDSSAGQ